MQKLGVSPLAIRRQRSAGGMSFHPAQGFGLGVGRCDQVKSLVGGQGEETKRERALKRDEVIGDGLSVGMINDAVDGRSASGELEPRQQRRLKLAVGFDMNGTAGRSFDGLQKLLTDRAQRHEEIRLESIRLRGELVGRLGKRTTDAHAAGVTDRQLILYQFSRDKVERGDYSNFLSRFGLERLPRGEELARLMGGMAFMVEGYDFDSRELYAIPEVRRFYGAFHRAWPYWLYFCDLNQDSLKTMILCCLPSLTSLASDARSRVGVKVDPTELLQFIAEDFAPMNLMCERARLSELAIYDRTKTVMEYFGFPFDEPPP